MSNNAVDVDYWTIRLFAGDFLGSLHRSAFAKLSIILVRFANAILESLSFPVYVLFALESGL